MTFRLARPKITAAFKPIGPQPIIAQSNNVSIGFYLQLFSLNDFLNIPSRDIDSRALIKVLPNYLYDCRSMNYSNLLEWLNPHYH